MATLLWAYCFKLINTHVPSPFICFFIYFELPHWNLQCFSVLRVLAGISQLTASLVVLQDRNGIKHCKSQLTAPKVTFGAQLNEFLGLLTLLRGVLSACSQVDCLPCKF